MSPFFNSLLAIVFLVCGIAATFIMLELRGAPKDRPMNATLIKLHKMFGWIFMGIFLLLVIVMIIKVSGYKEEISRLQALGETLTQHGTAIALALLILISGFLIAKWLHNTLRRKMQRLNPQSKIAPIACNSIYIIIVAVTIMGTAVEFGAQPVNLVRLTAIIVLIVIGVMVFLRPIIPTLPFKVGNYVKAGELLEKAKLRFDNEGIQFAFPQLDLHIEPNEMLKSEIGQLTGNQQQPVFSDLNPVDEENILR